MGGICSRDYNADLVPWNPGERWEKIVGDNVASISEHRGGMVGLSNLGNTCFMNVGLQCLSHIEPICAYFLTGKYQDEINPNNPLGTGGDLARSFAKLQEDLWQKSCRSHTPTAIYRTLRKFAPHLLRGGEQQDAHELITYLLDGLHEDINLVREKPEPPKPARSTEEEEEEDLRQHEESVALEQENGEEYIAALAWMHHLLRNKSFFVDLFQGQLRSRLTCSRCGCVSKTFDPFLYLSLPVDDKMRSLSDAIRGFMVEEALSGNERWKCPRCKLRVDATKHIQVWKLPPVLVIHFKRFEYDTRTNCYRKIQTELQSSLTVNLEDFVDNQREPLIYDVVCVANHTGQFSSGHYTATCRHHVNGKYYRFNDGTVTEVRNSADVLTSKAYVLFLVRQPPGNSLVRQSASHPEAWPHALSARNSLMLPAVWGVANRLRRNSKKAAENPNV